MASLATHFAATLFLLPVGVRRLISTSSLFLNHHKTPQSPYRSKPWYLSEPKWKNLDLYILSFALPIACFSLIFLFLSLPSSDTNPTYRFSFLQQSLLLFGFWVLTILFVFGQNVDPFVINDCFLFCLGGVLFLMEYGTVGKGIDGVLGGTVYGLCGDLTLLCGFCCFFLAVRPHTFFAEFCLSCGLVLKGTWFLQAGLCLYTDAFAFKGCAKVSQGSGNGARVSCDLEEDALRGVALVNLLFVGHAIGVLLLSLGVFAILSSNRHLRHGEVSGPLLSRIETENALMRPVTEFELE